MSTSPVLVIGAGPAGLAAAAALPRGVPAVVLERADAVGASWRRHYERLHLHTTRRRSGLPGLPIPLRSAGGWPATTSSGTSSRTPRTTGSTCVQASR